MCFLKIVSMFVIHIDAFVPNISAKAGPKFSLVSPNTIHLVISFKWQQRQRINPTQN